jgi:tripartite-type tricarboxylate transporter receptor subunit TctC
MNAFFRMIGTGFVAFALSLSQVSHGESFSPVKPIRFIVPSPPGASNDVAARAIARELTKLWKQPVIIDNRPGAGTTIAAHAIATAPPDGHTFGWVIAAHAINPSLYPKLPYDTVRDFAGVTLVYHLKAVIVSAPAFPANSVAELIAIAKAKPGQLSYATPQTGSSVHLVSELFKLKYGVDMTHIGYKGGPAAYPDVISGRVPVMFDTLPGALQQIKLGKLKVIALVSDTPVAGYPEFPLLSGLLPADATMGWNGIVAPARTSKATVAKLNTDIIAAVRSPEVQERFASLTVETITSTPEQFDAFIREEINRWGNVVRRAGIKLDDR